jgi:hypothetical protein
MAEAACPVFVWPMARSGGTLLATLIGAHSRIAMSYEIYEDGLLGDDGAPLEVGQAAAILASARNASAEKWVAGIKERAFRAFVARAHRGGLPPETVLNELRAHQAQGAGFDSLDGRLDFVERLMRVKMQRDGKDIWGGKAKAELADLARRNPRAAIFMMVRDGRDILASRSNTGSFNKDARTVAKEWVEKLDEFSAFARRQPGRAQLVVYEDLVREPRRVLGEIFGAVGVPFEESVLRYETAELSLVRHSYGHLSAKRIAEGLNDKTVGRWRREVDAEALRVFEEVAGEHLRRWNYSTR